MRFKFRYTGRTRIMKQNITEPYKEESISKRKPGMDMFERFPVALPTFRSQGHFMIEYNW